MTFDMFEDDFDGKGGAQLLDHSENVEMINSRANQVFVVDCHMSS